MLEIAKSLLLCQNHHRDGDGSDLEGLTPREGHSTEKLKFKLIGLQLVNQIFCRKLKKRREESERLSNIIVIFLSSNFCYKIALGVHLFFNYNTILEI